MIKFFAAMFMLIDHVGVIFFPNNIFMRIVGRLSMPMFGYCIARGFYYSEKKGRTNIYIKNLFIFSIVSQIPFNAIEFYSLSGLCEQSIKFNEFLRILFNKNFFFILELNIGFTWMVSVILLKLIESLKYSNLKFRIFKILIIILILLSSLKIPIEGGLFVLLLTLIFYFCLFKFKNNILCIVLNVPLYIIYLLTNYIKYAFEKGFNFFIAIVTTDVQCFYFLSIFLILILRKIDFKILPKRFFYCFYPIHFVVLLTSKFLFFS